jgi:hypothetical protein
MTENVNVCCLAVALPYFRPEEGFVLLQSNDEIIISRGKLKKFGEKPAPVPLPPSKILK